MSLRTYRLSQALILILTALFFLQRLWSGKMFYYINERFFILVILAAIGFLLLAQVVLPIRPNEPDAHTHEGHDHNHDHDHAAHRHPHLAEAERSQRRTRQWSLLILALPVILGFLVPPKSLGASAIATKGLRTTAGNSLAGGAPVQLELPADDRTILDWIRMFNYAEFPEIYAGQRADVIGFVYHDSRLAEEQFLVGRFTLSCCVADAFAIGMVVNWPEAAELPDNSWVRVKGPVEVTQLDGQTLPLIQAESLTPVSEPTEPYLFP